MIAFLINKIPSSILQYKSPYQVLYESKLDYQSLNAFGCLTYVITLSSSRNKFIPYVIPSIFVSLKATRGTNYTTYRPNKVRRW